MKNLLQSAADPAGAVVREDSQSFHALGGNVPVLMRALGYVNLLYVPNNQDSLNQV